MHSLSRRPLRVVALLVAGGIGVAGCGSAGRPATGPPPSPRSDSSPGGTGSPATISPGSKTLSGTPTPSDPGATPSEGTGSPTAGATVASASCATVVPLRLERLDTEPRRTTEVVTVVSDGRNLTSGTREQSDFLAPTLKSPGGAEVTDESTVKKIASLIATSAKNRVLLSRPNPPDARASANVRPFNAAGTYVLFNASAPLNAEVVVQCGGQEQRWSFSAEADPTASQVNCAVEPPKTNAVARLVYQNNC